MLYTALNLTTDEVFASNSFKTIYQAVMTNITAAFCPSLADRWSIKRHANLDADNFSFQDVIFTGEELCRVIPSAFNISIWRKRDNKYFNVRKIFGDSFK